MTVTKYFNLEGEVSVQRERANKFSPDAKLLGKAIALCSDATYENGEGTGDPTEIALLALGTKRSIPLWPRLSRT